MSNLNSLFYSPMPFWYNHLTNNKEDILSTLDKNAHIFTYPNKKKDCDETCNICFESLKNTKVCEFACLHYFHYDCIRKYVESNANNWNIPTCPYCRKSIYEKHPKIKERDEQIRLNEIRKKKREEISKNTKKLCDMNKDEYYCYLANKYEQKNDKEKYNNLLESVLFDKKLDSSKKKKYSH